MYKVTISTSWVVLITAVSCLTALAGETPYNVKDGKVDAFTFEGWQKYRAGNCGQCHGGAGQGGAAPSLVERLKTISEEQFKLRHGG